ncbi:hypothetical protein GCM10009815_35940 [Nocardioides marmoribigeumensis]
MVTGTASGPIDAGASKTFQVACPVGEYTPISGGYSSQNGLDLRRASERLEFGKGGYYEVRLDNNDTGASDVVTLTVLCVPTSYFSTSTKVSTSSYSGSGAGNPPDQRNFGGATCPTDSWFALQPTVSFDSPGTLLAAGRTNEHSAWHVEGWNETAGVKMTVTVTCVPFAEVPAFYSTAHTDSLDGRWATPVTVSCPSGMTAIGGSTMQDGIFTIDGAWGAISILGHVSGNSYSATTETLAGGKVYTRVECLPAANPTVSVAGQPWPDSRSGAAHWTWSATDPASGGFYKMAYTCTVEHVTQGTSEAPFSCTSPYDATGLPDGVHRLTVKVTTDDGREATGTSDVVVDTTSPTVALTAPTKRFTLGSSVTVRWSGSDATTAVASYRTRFRSAGRNGAWSTWGTPVTSAGTATARTFTGLRRGRTYCFATQAVDARGNVSAWTVPRCTAVPWDDRDLSWSSGWTRTQPSSWFRGTASSTRTRGQNLVIDATTRRIALVAQRCPTCGKVEVRLGATRIGVVDLSGPLARRVFNLPAFSTRTGTVTVRVLSDGKLVKVDALGLSVT